MFKTTRKRNTHATLITMVTEFLLFWFVKMSPSFLQNLKKSGKKSVLQLAKELTAS
jgi:hypothetical protein